jgi:hypothetical protein
LLLKIGTKMLRLYSSGILFDWTMFDPSRIRVLIGL